MPDTTQPEDNMDILLVENLMLRDKLARAMELLHNAVNLTEIQGSLSRILDLRLIARSKSQRIFRLLQIEQSCRGDESHDFKSS